MLHNEKDFVTKLKNFAEKLESEEDVYRSKKLNISLLTLQNSAQNRFGMHVASSL